MVDRYDDEQKKPEYQVNMKKIPVRQTAIALQDSEEKDGTPVITAAGRGKIAEKIIQLAFENGIKVREDSTLAEMLATIEIDSPIPSEAFMAVAEVLAYVYRANGQPNPFDTPLTEKK